MAEGNEIILGCLEVRKKAGVMRSDWKGRLRPDHSRPDPRP